MKTKKTSKGIIKKRADVKNICPFFFGLIGWKIAEKMKKRTEIQVKNHKNIKSVRQNKKILKNFL